MSVGGGAVVGIEITGRVKEWKRTGGWANQKIEILPEPREEVISIIEILVKLANGNYCYNSIIALCCLTTPEVSTSVETIGRSASFTAIVDNSEDSPGPYEWEVVGFGFFFDAGLTEKTKTTELPTVTIYTSATACGFCDINVVDKCGNEGQGGIRCTEGTWVEECNSGLYADGYPDGDAFNCCWRHGNGTLISQVGTLSLIHI